MPVAIAGACCYTPQAVLSRSLSATSSRSDSQCLYEVPPDVDEEDFQKNKQNNACLCCPYYDSDFEPEGSFFKRKSYRSGPSKLQYSKESLLSTDLSTAYDMRRIYDKILQVANLERQRSRSNGSQPLCGTEGRNKSPIALGIQKKPPHTRNLVRANISNRFHMYQRMWKAQPPIGENFHFSFRQKIRQKMLKNDQAQLPHKVFVPNLYVAPTEKKRHNLRLAVRKCIQDYRMPPVGAFYDL